MAAEPQPPWENAYEAAPKHEWFADEQWFDMVLHTVDADLRAHRIALTYYHLGAYFDAYLHNNEDAGTRQSTKPSVPLNANWFHFAMWGTLTVTQNVTTQRSPQRLNAGVPAPLRRALTPAILRARSSDEQRVGRALGWGQLAIFASAAQLVSELNTDGTITEAETLAKINERLGNSPIDLNLARHVHPMKVAFEYYKCAHDGLEYLDRVTHAWLMFGANVLLTTVEQDLADGAIEVVLDHFPDHLASAIDWRLAKLSARFRGVPANLAYSFLRSMHPNQRKVLYTIWSRLMTDQLLVMALPTEALRLGRDIPPRHREWPIFPQDLREFPPLDPATDVGADLAAIVSLVKSLDRTIAGAGTRGSAARDWRRWDERMNWAVSLIRSRQQDDTLFWAPYSVADQWRIVDGKLPERLGDASTLDVQAPTDRFVIGIGRTEGQ